MKLKQHTLLFLLILTAFSCRKEEASIFPLSPAERVNHAISDYYTLLTNAPNGWVMDYFATSESPGYPLLVKFNTSGSAIIASKSNMTKNGNYEQDDCLFDVIADNGPVLTFDTYNKILHAFSNPENPNGYGLEGDYEFIIMKAVTDTVWMKGKKNNARIQLRRLPIDRPWEAYVTSLSDLSNQLFSLGAPKLTMKIGKVNYSFTQGASGIFTITKEGANSFTTSAPFIVQTNGIRFYSPQTIEEMEFLSFQLNEDKSALVSTEHPDYQLNGTADLSMYFLADAITEWKLSPTVMSSDVRTLYDAIVQSCQQQYAAYDVKLLLTYNNVRKDFVFSLSFTTGVITNEGLLDLKINSAGKDLLALSYKGTGNANGLQYYDEVNGLKGLMTYLSSEFLVNTPTKLNPTALKLTKRNNNQSWFTLMR